MKKLFLRRKHSGLNLHQRRKDNLIEAHNAIKLERFAANCASKSLSTVKMRQKAKNYRRA